MTNIYEERGIEKGLVVGKRDSLRKLLALRFGVLPQETETRLQALNTEAELDALLERVLTAPTLQDMGL